MEFKIGKTCDGCDRILKNMKKISTTHSTDKLEDSIEKNAGAAKADVNKYLEKTTKDVEMASKDIVKKMNANAVHGKKGRKFNY